MRNLNTFYQCCRYLDISIDLPECQVDQKQFQAAYKLRVCTRAWNKEDEFEPDQKATYLQENVGYIPHFYFKGGKLLSSGKAYSGSAVGLVYAHAAYTPAAFGLRLCLSTEQRAVEFSETFIDIFNELL